MNVDLFFDVLLIMLCDQVFGFVYIQDVIDRAIINVVTNTTVREPGGYLQQFPYPCYNFDR